MVRVSPSSALFCALLVLSVASASCEQEPKRRSGPINNMDPDDEAPGAGGTGGKPSGTGGKGGSTQVDAGSPSGGSGGSAGAGGSSGAGGAGGSGGAPADAGSDRGSMGSPDTAPVATAPKLSTHVAPIAKKSCAVTGCHDPNKKEHGMDVSTPAGVMMSWVNKMTADHCQNNKAVTRVVPGMPDASFVVKLITSTNYCAEVKRMPPPPLAMLTPAEIQIIKDWIAAGAKND
jgi:hypothetical protein